MKTLLIALLLIPIALTAGKRTEANASAGTGNNRNNKYYPPCYYTWDRKIWDRCPYPYPQNWNGSASTVPPGSYYYNGYQYMRKQSNTGQNIKYRAVAPDTLTIRGIPVANPEAFRNIK